MRSDPLRDSLKGITTVIDQKWIGHEFPASTLSIERVRLQSFAKATAEKRPLHTDVAAGGSLRAKKCISNVERLRTDASHIVELAANTSGPGSAKNGLPESQAFYRLRGQK